MIPPEQLERLEADYAPEKDVSARLIIARKEAIRAAFNYRHTRWPRLPNERHVADDDQVNRCYQAFLDNDAWSEIIAAADAVVNSVLGGQLKR